MKRMLFGRCAALPDVVYLDRAECPNLWEFQRSLPDLKLFFLDWMLVVGCHSLCSICGLIDHCNLSDWLFCPHLYTSFILGWLFWYSIKLLLIKKKNPSSTPPHLFDQLMLSELLLAFLIDLFVIDWSTVCSSSWTRRTYSVKLLLPIIKK